MDIIPSIFETSVKQCIIRILETNNLQDSILKESILINCDLDNDNWL